MFFLAVTFRNVADIGIFGCMVRSTRTNIWVHCFRQSRGWWRRWASCQLSQTFRSPLLSSSFCYIFQKLGWEVYTSVRIFKIRQLDLYGRQLTTIIRSNALWPCWFTPRKVSLAKEPFTEYLLDIGHISDPYTTSFFWVLSFVNAIYCWLVADQHVQSIYKMLWPRQSQAL